LTAAAGIYGVGILKFFEKGTTLPCPKVLGSLAILQLAFMPLMVKVLSNTVDYQGDPINAALQY